MAKTSLNHKLSNKRRQLKLIALGFKSGKSPTIYIKQLEYNKAWNKSHHKAIKLASQRQRLKMIAAGFPTGHHGAYLYPRLRKDGKGRLKGLGN